MRLWLLFLLALVSVSAKDLTNWDAVSGLGKGEGILVSRKGGAEVKGRLSTASASSVSVETGSGDVTVDRAEVVTVGVRKAGRGKWIGLAVGAIGGLAAGAALGTRLANEGQANKGAVAAGVGAAGAALGFGIGASGDAGYKTVYRVR